MKCARKTDITGKLFFVYSIADFDLEDLTFFGVQSYYTTNKQTLPEQFLFGERFCDHIPSHSVFRSGRKQWRKEC